MAPLSNHVALLITRDSVGVARAGFGVPLILSGLATFPDLIRFYSSAAEVIEDFPDIYGPEYRAAAALFSQSVYPSRIAIGKSSLPPTQVYSLAIAAVRNSYTYRATVRGSGFDEVEVTYVSDASATDGEIVIGLVAALNAVADNNYIAAGTSGTFTVTADAAGEWFSIEVDPVDISIAQTHANPGVATDLAALAVASNEWYALLTLYNSNAYVLAAAAWVEANGRIYIADVNESAAVQTAVGNSDTLDDLATLGYARTMGAYHPAPGAMLAAAWAGRVLPLDPGGETWKYKTLVGVPAVSLTSTQRTNLIARSANSYETIAGRDITFEGTTADGDFLDVQRGLDWWRDDLTKSVFEILAGVDKIPFIDAGVAMIESGVRASASRAVARTILSDNPGPVVTVPLVGDVSDANKAARTLPDIRVSGTLAGAIHKVSVTAVVSV